MMEFCTEMEQVARKPHICEFCGREIKQGERYQRFAGKCDGCFFDCCYHLACREIVSEYCEYTGEDFYDVEEAREWLKETICNECEHSDDYSTCPTSIYECPETLKRFAQKNTAKKKELKIDVQ